MPPLGTFCFESLFCFFSASLAPSSSSLCASSSARSASFFFLRWFRPCASQLLSPSLRARFSAFPRLCSALLFERLKQQPSWHPRQPLAAFSLCFLLLAFLLGSLRLGALFWNTSALISFADLSSSAERRPLPPEDSGFRTPHFIPRTPYG